jgi:hypothetical protein
VGPTASFVVRLCGPNGLRRMGSAGALEIVLLNDGFSIFQPGFVVFICFHMFFFFILQLYDWSNHE